MSKKLDRYKRERDSAQAQVRRYEDKEKILAYQMQQEKRKKRTHRLCTRAGKLESFLKEPLILTDDDIYELLRFLFSLPGAREKEAALTQARLEQIISGELTGEVLP